MRCVGALASVHADRPRNRGWPGSRLRIGGTRRTTTDEQNKMVSLWASLGALAALDLVFALASQRVGGTLSRQAWLSLARATAALWITTGHLAPVLIVCCVAGTLLAQRWPLMLPLVVLPVLEEAFFRGAVLLHLPEVAVGWRVVLSSAWFVANHGMEGAPWRAARAVGYSVLALQFGLESAMAGHVCVNVCIRLMAERMHMTQQQQPHGAPQHHVVRL